MPSNVLGREVPAVLESDSRVGVLDPGAEEPALLWVGEVLLQTSVAAPQLGALTVEPANHRFLERVAARFQQPPEDLIGFGLPKYRALELMVVGRPSKNQAERV
jgi:hypothetical protein